ncbi:MAG: mycothiol system anti-sigma-R factor [Acidimicrobiaceae bacterium]|nr:mycothiol system anti-sigma-R factor [Acidimicrobiaceae bacterium]
MDNSQETDSARAGCQETIARLYTFLDGELTQDRKEKIRQHLDECSPCLEAFEFESELRSMIASKSRDRCPDSIRAKVEAILKYGKVV